MLLGFASFSERPLSTVDDDSGVLIQVVGNALSISIGSVGIIATSIVENVGANPVTLGLGTVTLTADSNFTVTGNATSLGIGNFTVTADANTSVTGNSLTLSTGNVTVNASAVVNPLGSQVVANTGDPSVIAWENIVPGVTMVWTPIDPS